LPIITTSTVTISTSTITNPITTTTLLKPVIQANTDTVFKATDVVKLSVKIDVGEGVKITLRWIIKIFGNPNPIEVADTDSLEYTFKSFKKGLKYAYKVGYKTLGVRKATGDEDYTWSDEAFFKVGDSEQEIKDIAAATEMKDFKMLSFGQWPDNPNSLELFGSQIAGGYDTQNYRIGTYAPEFGDYTEFGNDLKIEPGKAYWFLAKKGLKITSTGVPVATDQDVYIALKNGKNGWNMIASPSNRAYNWSDVKVVAYDASGNMIFGPIAMKDLPDSNNYIDKKLWAWTDGQYSSSATKLQAYQGYWIKVKQENVSLLFPANASQVASNDLAQEEALIKATLRQATGTTDATDTPPSPMNYTGSSIPVVTEDDGGSSGCFIKSLLD